MAGRFTHLLGLGRPGAGKLAEKPDDQRDDETDEDYADRKKREEDDANAAAAGRKSAEKPDDQGDDESDEDYADRKKREEDDANASEEDEDEDDKKDKGDAKATAARKRERARCAAIFASKHAATRPDLAAHLAFETGMGRKAACAMLRTAAAGSEPGRRGLDGRMAAIDQPRPGAGGPSGKPPIASSWDAAASRVGLRRK